jgi:hypothetical protein
MLCIQWDDAHINDFVSKFKDEIGDINAAKVSHWYSQKRRKGEPRAEAPDYKNLMLKVVQSRFARVTYGFFTSKNYTIRMVSDGYPYEHPDLDDNLFNYLELFDLVPNIDELTLLFPEVDSTCWSSNYKEKLSDASNLARAFHVHLYAWKYLGGDLSGGLSLAEASLDKTSSQILDYQFLQIKLFVHQYKALRLTAPELSELYQDLKVTDHNALFFKVVQSRIIYDIWKSVGSPGNHHLLSSNAAKKKLNDILGHPGEDYELPVDSYSEEFEDARFLCELVEHLPTERPEVLAAVDAWKKTFTEMKTLERNIWK